MKKPFAVYLLLILIFFQALSGLFGGMMLVISPSGSFFQMNAAEMLHNAPFANFLIPGLILLILLGLFPAFVSVSLMIKPSWKRAGMLNIYNKKHWAWTYSLYSAIMLILWIDIEIMMLGGGHILQTIYALLGVAILIIALVPAVQHYYEMN
jgi:hypothetical protein